MRQLFVRFVKEEIGCVTGPEWAFVVTILVLAAITGAVMTKHAADRTSAEAPAASVAP
jgi:hypothetical protein